MNRFLPFSLQGQELLVTASRTIYWEAEKFLVLSDLHLGKSGHFRKSGIAIPQNIFKEDMQRLMDEIQFFKPKDLIIVGDLFHSSLNLELDLFARWRRDIPHVGVQLIKGNHDILKADWYQQNGIEVHPRKLSVSNFSFVHDIADCADEGYCFSGHIHPGIRIRGLGRQSVQLPCFYFGKSHAVLPAFGKFTGTYPVRPEDGDSVFALVENSVMQLQ